VTVAVAAASDDADSSKEGSTFKLGRSCGGSNLFAQLSSRPFGKGGGSICRVVVVVSTVDGDDDPGVPIAAQHRTLKGLTAAGGSGIVSVVADGAFPSPLFPSL
jgi:hypothetical protein